MFLLCLLVSFYSYHSQHKNYFLLPQYILDGVFLCVRHGFVRFVCYAGDEFKRGARIMAILEARHLMKVYGAGENRVRAVDDVSLTVEKGQFVAIVGTSGSGKTTLLNLLGGLDYADGGEIVIDGQMITAMRDEELTVFRRRRIGFIFQHYNLVSMLDVYKNITLPIRLDGHKVDEAFLEQIVRTLGIEKKLKNRPNELSGGQQQRVAIARAIASKPALVLADEPTGNLDSRTSEEVMGLLQMTSRRFGQTIIMITHNEEIAQLADHIIHIEDGRIVGGGADV